MSATLGRPREAFAALLHRPPLARAAIVFALFAGTVSGVAVGMQAAAVSEAELMHLLRAMAILKSALIAAAAGAILWRLQAPVRPAWLTAYAATCAAMAAGPGLIWFSSHIILASILLHAGLIAAVLLLWRDGTTTELLRGAVIRRRTVARQGD